MSASWPPSTRSTSASTVASPHSRRWLPSTQRSPGLLTGSSGGSGTSSSASSDPRLAVRDRQQPLELGRVEADQVEIEALVPEPRQLRRQQLLAPAGLQGQLVVGDQVRPLLRLAQVLEPDHRHLGEPELAGRQQPAVAGEDAALLVDQDRVGPAELDHARPRSGRPARRCACAGCARTGAGGRSATARSGRRARPARCSAVRRSTCEPHGATGATGAPSLTACPTRSRTPACSPPCSASWSGSRSRHLSCWRRTRWCAAPPGCSTATPSWSPANTSASLPSTRPRTSQTCQAAGQEWPCGDAAGTALSKLTADHEVVCRAPARDRYRRLLGTCFVGELNLNAEMVRLGYALPGFHAAACPARTTAPRPRKPAPRAGHVARPVRRALGLAARAALTGDLPVAGDSANRRGANLVRRVRRVRTRRSQPDSQASSRWVRPVRRLRRQVRTLEDSKARKSAAFRPPGATGSANCEPGIAPCR